MRFGFRPHPGGFGFEIDPETIRQHFEQRQKCEELIKCSDGVYRPESMVEEFENSVPKLPMVIEQPDEQS